MKKNNEYVAIISMDGDRMGNLVKGRNNRFAKRIDIMHSALPDSVRSYLTSAKNRDVIDIDNILKEKRTLFPCVHQFLSESLADFSLLTVPYVINKYGGQVIYAGGDDVVALFSVRNALTAANEIRDYYRTPFVKMDVDGNIKKCSSEYESVNGERLFTHPGGAVSMSAAVVFARSIEACR